jgi:imidazolonepropionase-like amidohydrolase
VAPAALVESFARLAGPKFAWMGAFVGFVAAAIMCYYAVVAGWCFFYFGSSLFVELPPTTEAAMATWDGFQARGWPLIFHASAMGIAAVACWHGVRSIEDPALVEDLAERGIVLECCPTSNVVLDLFPSYEDHPLPVLADAGVKVTLGSDDPPYFGASIGGEYAICRERYGFDDERLRSITRTAIEAAFCEETLKGKLTRRV